VRTDDTVVATIYETGREKRSAALTDTVLQLDEHENARARSRGNGTTGGAANPKRCEDSADTTRANISDTSDYCSTSAQLDDG